MKLYINMRLHVLSHGMLRLIHGALILTWHLKKVIKASHTRY